MVYGGDILVLNCEISSAPVRKRGGVRPPSRPLEGALSHSVDVAAGHTSPTTHQRQVRLHFPQVRDRSITAGLICLCDGRGRTDLILAPDGVEGVTDEQHRAFKPLDSSPVGTGEQGGVHEGLPRDWCQRFDCSTTSCIYWRLSGRFLVPGRGRYGCADGSSRPRLSSHK